MTDLAFKDSDFELACKELEEPQTEGWEFFTESHGVTIYRMYNEVIFIYNFHDVFL
jgi:hypothetical protein